MNTNSQMTGSPAAPTIAIIGSGFGGVGMGYYLKQAGIESFTIFEKAADLGGVWRENTYPGAACDVPSHLYSYSFEPHYPWTCRYGKQSEIHAYLHHTANKYDLMRHIRFGREVESADFDEKRGLWTVRFTSGETFEANILISSVGQLHRPMIPDIKGRETFRGSAFHSARWDHGYDFNGKSVAVIGTGASAVQFVPEIAKQVKQLFVFQRSPSWVISKFDKVFKPWERWLLDHLPFIHDMDRQRIFWLIEFINSALQGYRVTAFLVRIWALLTVRLQVKDPQLRKRFTPDYPIGCKRILLSNDWLPALARPNVEVVTDAITEITPTGVHTADGKLREVDALIYGTGFTATQFLAPMRIRGSKGRELGEVWKHGAEAYLGMSVAGFPNFFMLYGPNTNLGAGSIIYMLEHQQRYVLQCIQQFSERRLRTLEVRAEAQRRFNERLQARSQDTAFGGNCHSWYKTEDGRNTNNWAGFVVQYGLRTRRPELDDFQLQVANDAAG